MLLQNNKLPKKKISNSKINNEISNLVNFYY